MELGWSEQAPHIHSLYTPWQPGDGYDEEDIVAREAVIGARLPPPLRIFYRAWGRRWNMTQTTDHMVGLAGLIWRPDALVFCVENQGCCWWAIERHNLAKPDPPVAVADPENWNIDDIHVPLIWKPSHAHLSDFLDRFIYQNAFSGGAIHGGTLQKFYPQEFQIEWLEHHWHRSTVNPMLLRDADVDYGELPLYIREGQALICNYWWWSVVARESAALDEIGHALQVKWKERW